MFDSLQPFLWYIPFLLLLPTVLTSLLLLFLIITSSPKFIKVYSTVLTIYTLVNLLAAAAFALIQPRLWMIGEDHLFSTRFYERGAPVLLSIPIHLVYFSILILLYILFIRLFALKGVAINRRIAILSTLALYFTLPIGILLLMITVKTRQLETPVPISQFVLSNFWDFLAGDNLLFLPIILAAVAIFLNVSSNSLIFSREISLGYVHRVLICKRMAESIMWQSMFMALCLSGSAWLVRFFPQFAEITSYLMSLSLALFFSISPLHLAFTIRPFHEKLQSFLGRRYSEENGKSISITFDASDSRNGSNSNPPIS